MALIGLAIFSTEQNKKDTCLRKTLACLAETVDFTKHKLGVSVNAYTDETIEILEDFEDIIKCKFVNDGNIGTAAAINRVWQLREPNQHLLKMDDDVDIMQSDWLDLLEEGIERMPDTLGIFGLKRKDCMESPDSTHPFYKSELFMLPHKAGEKWIVGEKVSHVMGTCQLFNHRLIDKIGGLFQMKGLYGFDDSLAAVRCQKAGYISAFLHGIEIDHLDEGKTPYQSWKEGYANTMMNEYNKTKRGMMEGTIPINYPL